MAITIERKGLAFVFFLSKSDQEQSKLQLEIEMVLATGQANENDVMDKNGWTILCTGESPLVLDRQGKIYGKGYSEFATKELLVRMFESSKDFSILILDGSKVQKRRYC